mgnify:CR=1 FL=1
MKILLFFHNGSTNRGTSALAISAVKVIRQQYPEAYIALASMDPATDKAVVKGIDELISHNQKRGLKRLSKAWFSNFIEIRTGKPNLTAYRLMHQDIIQRIKDFDVFLSIGGDNYCYGDIPDYYEMNRQIKAQGKKLLLWGGSIGKEDVTPDMLKDLKGFDALLLREPHSFEEMKGLGLNNVYLVADGAFVLDKEYLPLPEEWEEGNTIGFNYSPLIFKRHPESRSAALQLLKHILDATSYKIAMTPHVIQPHLDNDDWVCMQELRDELKDYPGYERICMLPNDLTAVQYKGFIARQQLLITARTHASIAAYSAGVPTLVLGYSIKSRGIAEDLFGQVRLVLDKTEISDAGLLIQKFDELVRDQNEIRNILNQRVSEIQNRAYSAANYL